VLIVQVFNAMANWKPAANNRIHGIQTHAQQSVPQLKEAVFSNGFLAIKQSHQNVELDTINILMLREVFLREKIF